MAGIPSLIAAENMHRGHRLLLVVLGCVGVVWLVILPRVTETEAVRCRVERNEQLGIDPTAMFYTEHSGVSRWVASVERSRRRIEITTGSAE